MLEPITLLLLGVILAGAAIVGALRRVPQSNPYYV
jgi:hypothetical protein